MVHPCGTYGKTKLHKRGTHWAAVFTGPDGVLPSKHLGLTATTKRAEVEASCAAFAADLERQRQAALYELLRQVIDSPLARFDADAEELRRILAPAPPPQSPEPTNVNRLRRSNHDKRATVRKGLLAPGGRARPMADRTGPEGAKR